MQSRRPLLSVIVAVFNGVETLQQCIDSVVSQTYSNIELIIIDGASKDGTVSLLEANKGKIHYWISEQDGGIYNAWNKGVAKAKGEWICFLGADDYLWSMQSISELEKELTKLPSSVLIAYGQVMLLNESAQNIHLVGEPWLDIKDRFKQVMCIPHQGVLHRRSLFEKKGHFDESFRIAGDYEFLLRELRDNDAVFIAGPVVTGMRQGGISSAPENSLRALKEIRKAQVLHGLKYPGRIWVGAFIRSHIKVWLWGLFGEVRVRRILDFYRRMVKLPPYWTKL
jgi:glycosyltransferase involved in cell wall biosynthesis